MGVNEHAGSSYAHDDCRPNENPAGRQVFFWQHSGVKESAAQALARGWQRRQVGEWCSKVLVLPDLPGQMRLPLALVRWTYPSHAEGRQAGVRRLSEST
jgi:hypothetical protein